MGKGGVSSTHEHHDYLRKHKFPVPVKREDVERDWKPRGYSCDLFVDPPGRAWEDFVHREDELVTLVSGSMEFTIGNDRVVLEPGDEVFIPAGKTWAPLALRRSMCCWILKPAPSADDVTEACLLSDNVAAVAAYNLKTEWLDMGATVRAITSCCRLLLYFAGAKHSTKNIGNSDAHWLYGYA
ncbi:hypothetical protein ABPG77_003652 [Micractinium sp. CCAP 211/92]